MFLNANSRLFLRPIINGGGRVLIHRRRDGRGGGLAFKGLKRMVMVCALLLSVPQLGFADALTVQVTQGSTKRISVAVVPMANASYDYSTVIAEDLEHSGRFVSLDKSALVQNPHALSEIDLAQWRLVKADYIVVGFVKNDPEPTIDFAAVNVLSGETLFHYLLPVNASNPRRDAHRIANLVYEKVTGFSGVFDTKIAYVSVEGQIPHKHWRLVVADYDGENARVILDSVQPVMSPAFSANGAEIAYVSFENDHSQIFVQQLASGQRTVVSEHLGVNGSPAFSPDGQMMAMTLSQPNGNLDVYLLNRQNKALTRVTDDPAIDTEAQFSADGHSLFFTSDRAGRPQIYKLDGINGGLVRAQRLSFEGPYNARARLSLDGKSATVVTLDGGGYRVGLIDLASGRLTVLSNGNQDTSPSFAPNSQLILYAQKRGSSSRLNIVSVDGVTSTIRSKEGEVRDPVWCPSH